MRMHFDWSQHTRDLGSLPIKERLNRKEAQEHAQTLIRYTETARSIIAKAQERQRATANRHRREPDFGPGDWVHIIKRTWVTDRPSDKLDFPLTKRSYKITEMNGHSYRLEVPHGWRGSETFHADRLRRYPNNPLPGQETDNPDAETVNDGEEWEVERILASRIFGRGQRLQYQAEWRGWDPDPEHIWYPASDFKNAPEKLQEYHEANPEAAGPPVRLQIWREAAARDEFAEDHPDDNKAAPKATALRRSRRGRRGVT
jgi:hypothetical protein